MDLGANFNFVSRGDMDITAGRGGVQFTAPPTLGMIINSANPLTFEAGIAEENSNIRFVSSGTNAIMDFTSANGPLSIEADNNMITTAYSTSSWTANTNMVFTATRGDILFRSTSITGDHDLTLNGDNGVYITALERIEHRQVIIFPFIVFFF